MFYALGFTRKIFSATEINIEINSNITLPIGEQIKYDSTLSLVEEDKQKTYPNVFFIPKLPSESTGMPLNLLYQHEWSLEKGTQIIYKDAKYRLLTETKVDLNNIEIYLNGVYTHLYTQIKEEKTFDIEMSVAKDLSKPTHNNVLLSRNRIIRLNFKDEKRFKFKNNTFSVDIKDLEDYCYAAIVQKSGNGYFAVNTGSFKFQAEANNSEILETSRPMLIADIRHIRTSTKNEFSSPCFCEHVCTVANAEGVVKIKSNIRAEKIEEVTLQEETSSTAEEISGITEEKHENIENKSEKVDQETEKNTSTVKKV